MSDWPNTFMCKRYWLHNLIHSLKSTLPWNSIFLIYCIFHRISIASVSPVDYTCQILGHYLLYTYSFGPFRHSPMLIYSLKSTLQWNLISLIYFWNAMATQRNKHWSYITVTWKSKGSNAERSRQNICLTLTSNLTSRIKMN